MKEFMYDIDSYLIAAILLFSMAFVIEVGYRTGLKLQWGQNDSSKAHVNAILASLLGILALLLGFTFSLSLQRFDSRSAAVVEEANAIGTAWLRADLLPDAFRDDARQQLERYIDVRVRASEIDLAHDQERQALLDAAADLQRTLWALATEAARTEPNPVTTGLFVQALNDMIDALGRRDAELARHVPELVLLLLYGTFLMAALILGYTSGVSGHRASFVSYILVALIVCLVFLIIDLDRPRRGVIEVSQKSLLDLQQAVRSVTTHRN
ncbi:MAG: hypothetical protein AB7I04_16535 [Pseudomonadales bacterium]